MAEIVKVRKSTKSHVSSSLKNLESRGLIERIQSADNKKPDDPKDLCIYVDHCNGTSASVLVWIRHWMSAAYFGTSADTFF